MSDETKKRTRTIRHPEFFVSDVDVRYYESDPVLPKHHKELHVHQSYEIYFHLEGDVKFIVNGNTLSIVPGSVIITRPYEHHHCVYLSNAVHKHYVMYINAGTDLLRDVLEDGKNYLILDSETRSMLYGYLEEMLNGATPLRHAYCMLSVLNCLSNSSPIKPVLTDYPDVSMTVAYINENYFEKITVNDLAMVTGVSVNTLERHFRDKLRLSPTEYIRTKRLAKACEFLNGGSNVIETCMKCGYSDCSAFIRHFREAFGITPKEYVFQINGK